MTGRFALVVDDNDLMLNVLAELVERLGMATRSVASVAAVRRVSSTSGSPPAVLICDMELGDGTGVDVATVVCARWPGTPVLFVSARERESYPAIERIPRAAFLQKPFSLAALRAALVDLVVLEDVPDPAP